MLSMAIISRQDLDPFRALEVYLRSLRIKEFQIVKESYMSPIYPIRGCPERWCKKGSTKHFLILLSIFMETMAKFWFEVTTLPSLMHFPGRHAPEWREGYKATKEKLKDGIQLNCWVVWERKFHPLDEGNMEILKMLYAIIRSLNLCSEPRTRSRARILITSSIPVIMDA